MGKSLRSIRRIAASAGIVLVLAATPARAQSGVLLFTDKEQIQLKTYAEFLGAGILRITSGAQKDIPTIDTFRMIRCSITGWRPVAVMVASGDLFKSEYSERRMIPIAQRPVGVSAVTVRVADLEKPERIAGCNAIRRPEVADAFSFSSTPATPPITTRSGCAWARVIRFAGPRGGADAVSVLAENQAADARAITTMSHGRR